jgi:hypothetical protein
MARFRLRMRTMEINLPLGEIIIGRGPECYLRVDEPMVSRRHARLRVTPNAVILEDLGSRNGSRVNGINANGTVELKSGDILGVGTQQFTLEREDDPAPHRPTVNIAPQWIGNNPPSNPAGAHVSADESSANPVSIPGNVQFTSSLTNPGSLPTGVANPEPTSVGLDPPTAFSPSGQHGDNEPSDMGQNQNRGSAYRLFWGLSDRLLQMNRVEEAERMMAPRLHEMRTRAEAGEIPEESIVVDVLRRALKLASATKKDLWFGWIFEFARVCKHKMQLPLLDEIYAQVFVCRPAIGAKIVTYAQMIDDETIVVRLATLRRLCRE